eukprot:scaffold52481_cov34-Tisochrysis_lutea.AAC.1
MSRLLDQSVVRLTPTRGVGYHGKVAKEQSNYPSPTTGDRCAFVSLHVLGVGQEDALCKETGANYGDQGYTPSDEPAPPEGPDARGEWAQTAFVQVGPHRRKSCALRADAKQWDASFNHDHGRWVKRHVAPVDGTARSDGLTYLRPQIMRHVRLEALAHAAPGRDARLRGATYERRGDCPHAPHVRPREASLLELSDNMRHHARHGAEHMALAARVGGLGAHDGKGVGDAPSRHLRLRRRVLRKAERRGVGPTRGGG